MFFLCFHRGFFAHRSEGKAENDSGGIGLKRIKHTENLHELWNRFCAVVLVFATISCASLLSTEQASALYILTGVSDSAIVLDDSTQAEELKDFSSQLVYLGSKANGFEITVRAGKAVTVKCNGAVINARSKGETVSALLSRLHVEPSPLDMVLVELKDSAVELTVASDLTYYDQYSEAVAHDTVRTYTPDLPKGTEQVITAGSDGIRTAVYEVTYSAGELISRQFVEELDTTAVTEEILVGTGVSSVASSDRIASVSQNSDGSGVLTFQSGETMKFSNAKSMTATAYTAGHGGANYTTATGTRVQVGTVAVDKNVIPLGTRMYIVTNDGQVVYGMAVAADTGVKGNIVDLYHDTYQQCINFGRRSCTVYILE
jgi:3D (Asp-Asp-Asp) domain-containing protein